MEIAGERGGAGGAESIDLPDEAATVALAAWAAGFARPGDFLALAGDLGAGKTTFARAFLRAVLDDPELEAPSPTFTLMQVFSCWSGTFILGRSLDISLVMSLVGTQR